jgi:tape measure domain-containing protein
MADDSTKLIISIETILRGLDRTLKGLSQVERQLKTVANIKVGAQSSSSGFDKATAAAQKLQQQQRKLAVQATELANREERARQVTERLAAARERLAQASVKAATAETRGAQNQVRQAQEVARINQQTARQAQQNEAIRTRAAKTISDVQVREAKRGADAFVASLGQQIRASGLLGQQIQSLGNALRSLGQGASSLGIGLTAALTIPLVAIGKSSLDAAVTLDSLRRGLTAIVGSADEAGVQLTRLTEIAKLPGIGFEEAIQGSIRLQAVGFSAKDAEKALREFSNAVALTGGGREELARITVQLGQLAAKGKVLSQDLRPIIEAAPAVGRALKAAFGTVNADDIADMTTNSREFLDVLTKELERLPRAAGGAKNAFENFRDSIFRASSAIGDALIPALTSIIDVVGPVVTALAEAFRALPVPIQAALLVFGAIGAAVGPVLFLFGQLTTGVGRLLVGFGQLNALGIIPTIAGLRALAATSGVAAGSQLTLAEAETAFAFSLAATRAGIVLNTEALAGMAAAAIGAAEAEAVAGAGFALLTGSFLAIAAAIGVAIVAFTAFNKGEKEAVQITDEQIKTLNDQIDSLNKQAQFLDGLADGVKRTADEQARLEAIYRQLNTEAQVRVEGVDTELERLTKLREELEKIIRLRNQERQQQAATLAASLADTLSRIDANEKEISSVTRQIVANTKLKESLVAQGIASETIVRTQENGRDVITTLSAENRRLLGTQKELREATDALAKSSEQQSKTLAELEKQGVGNARQFLELAKSLGLFTGSIDEALGRMELFIKGQEGAADATDEFTIALKQQQRALDSLFKQARESKKSREEQVGDVANFIRENAVSLKDAQATLQFFINTIPGFGEKFRKELKLTGKSVDEFIRDALGSKDKGSNALVSAQERLADAIAKVSLAGADRQISAEKSKNDELLRLNEARFHLELISYREFIARRAELQKADAQGEIDRQQKVADIAAADAARAAKRARTGTPAVRVKAQADQEASIAKQIEANTRIAELKAKQKEIDDDAATDLALFDKERLKDFAALGRELDEIIGKEKKAADAAIDARFAEKLRELNNEKKVAINREAEAARSERRIAELDLKLQGAGLEERIQLTQELSAETDKLTGILASADIEETQAGINQITNLKTELKSLEALRNAQTEISRAQEHQSNLERVIAFEVNFRGLAEDEATRRRLEGEKLVLAAMEKQRAEIKKVILDLLSKGLTVPPALTEFIESLDAAKKGLTELSLPEQFARIEKEFDRLNDKRIRKIEDVERAVRHRDIAEAEGRLFIKRINGDYIGDLQQQLDLLKKLADESNKDKTGRTQNALQRQAAQAGQTVDDIRAATTEVADFNTALRSTSIDALREGFSQFFRDLTDNTKSAKDKLLSLLDAVRNRINDFIAERLADKLIESLFGTGKEGDEGLLGGLFNKILGIKPEVAGADTETAANTTATEDNTAKLGALTQAFGGQTAVGAALPAGVGGAIGVAKQIGGVIAGLFGKGDRGGETPTPVTADQGTTVIDAINIASSLLAQILNAINSLTVAIGGKTALGATIDAANTGGGIFTQVGDVISGLFSGEGGGGLGGLFGGAFDPTAAQHGTNLIDALNFNSDEVKRNTAALKENTDSQGSGEQQGGLSGFLQALAAGGGEATGNIIPAAPQGRVIRVAEGGYDEAVLTTDPKYALRQAAILREFLRRTRGLMGRFREVPEFAEGGMVSARDAEMNLLSTLTPRQSIPQPAVDMQPASGERPTINLRNINLLDRRQLVGGHMRSAEGARDILNIISENSDEIGRRIGVK